MLLSWILNLLDAFTYNSIHCWNSDQAEAHRIKTKAARERRAQRVAAKRETIVDVPVAAPVAVQEKAAKAKK